MTRSSLIAILWQPNFHTGARGVRVLTTVPRADLLSVPLVFLARLVEACWVRTEIFWHHAVARVYLLKAATRSDVQPESWMSSASRLIELMLLGAKGARNTVRTPVPYFLSLIFQQFFLTGTNFATVKYMGKGTRRSKQKQTASQDGPCLAKYCSFHLFNINGFILSAPTFYVQLLSFCFSER